MEVKMQRIVHCFTFNPRTKFTDIISKPINLLDTVLGVWTAFSLNKHYLIPAVFTVLQSLLFMIHSCVLSILELPRIE